MSKHLLWPPGRFRTKEDAILFLDCVSNNRKFPFEKYIQPYIRIGDMVVENPEYRDAPFEEQFV